LRARVIQDDRSSQQKSRRSRRLFRFVPGEAAYLRFFRAAARAALFRARVRAPFLADALRAALLLLPPLFFFAAAMVSLHDEVELSPIP
jgi:hypothetical protein